ncbi:MAG: hypothetical protein QNJ38_16885 [Prochloraceae cyanobacterium]|nr:hypothetical protein [Prochloraceae cyanobacterium]
MISVLLDDGISGFVEEFDDDKLIEILENNSDLIKQKGFSKDELIESLENEGAKHIFDDYFDRLDKLNEYYPLIESCYPGYQGGNNFLGSLISKVQFKYIMDAILLEEIPEKYTAESCKEKAFLCTVCDRSGWYGFKAIDLDEENYNFNSQYSTPIFITLPTKNEGEKIYISGLYRWELQLLCLDLPEEQSLIINSPNEIIQIINKFKDNGYEVESEIASNDKEDLVASYHLEIETDDYFEELGYELLIFQNGTCRFDSFAFDDEDDEYDVCSWKVSIQELLIMSWSDISLNLLKHEIILVVAILEYYFEYWEIQIDEITDEYEMEDLVAAYHIVMDIEDLDGGTEEQYELMIFQDRTCRLRAIDFVNYFECPIFYLLDTHELDTIFLRRCFTV